jgi:hypothetical protein
MKTYSLHYVYRVVFLILLYISTETTVKELSDFNYVSWSPMPRALHWYICVYLWYVLFTMAYKICIDDGNNIEAISLLGKIRLSADEITNVKDRGLSLKVSHQSGSFTVTTLIDGVANVKTLFATTAYHPKESSNDKKTISYRILLKYGIIILLIAFAVYIEYNDNLRLWNR